MSERIGFVGLGIMGLAMARNLANAGFELTAFNRTSTKAEEFAEGNQAAVAYSLAELARQSDVVITMLPADLAIKCATHSGSNVGRKIRDRVCPRPILIGLHAFHEADFPPSQIRLCVAGFMTRFATHSGE